jgi:DNA-binding XRE family transcriptional regulator
MVLRNRIRYYRIKAGLKQIELAKEIGLGLITVRQHERCERDIKGEHVGKYTKALGISQKQLFDLE